MSRVIAEHDVTVYQGHALDELAKLPDASVQCVVTSPPYFGLRDYGTEPTDWPEVSFEPMMGLPPVVIPAQRCSFGLEADPWAFVGHMVTIFREIRRVLASDGVAWLNLGDSFSGKANGGPSFDRHRGHGHRAGVVAAQGITTAFAPYKSMLGIPWRVAFALMGDGWATRNDNAWHKPNAMPDSVQDRFACRYEHVFLLAKSRRYWFDLDAVKIPATQRPGGNTDETRRAYAAGPGTEKGARRFGGNTASTLSEAFDTRNPGDVWSIPTTPFPGAHFACFPRELARRCILAGCPEGGLVLDPFAGTGTTLKVARSLGRNSIGIELNPDYVDIIRDRIGQTPLDFTEVTA